MSPRALRRAAERQNLKLVVKPSKTMAATASIDTASPLATFDFTGPEHDTLQISGARLAANRANAQLSTGPRTPEGKAKSSLNPVKTGLTARTVLLSTEDALIYQQHLDRNFSELSPVTDKEKALVQCIADTEWRLLRVAPLEASIYANGRRDLATQVDDEPHAANREALLLGKIFMAYRKDFHNLALQERRLRNQRQADIAELLMLKQERIEKAAREAKEAAGKRAQEIQRAIKINNNAHVHKLEFNPQEHGFDFSYDEFQSYCRRDEAQYRLTEAHLDFDEFLAAYRTARKEPKTA
jgi:hypothetical protein